MQVAPLALLAALALAATRSVVAQTALDRIPASDRLIETVAGGCESLPAATDGGLARGSRLRGAGALAPRGNLELLLAEHSRAAVFGTPLLLPASVRRLTRIAGLEEIPDPGSCSVAAGAQATAACLASALDATPAIRGLASDAAGNLYLSCSRVPLGGEGVSSERVLRVDGVTRRITTLAGGGPARGSGATVPATSIAFARVGALAFRPPASLLVSDVDDGRLWAVALDTGAIHLLAGVGAAGGSGDQSGIATRSALASVADIAVDVTGTVWIAENAETPAGTFGIISALDPAAGTISPPRHVDTALRGLAVSPEGTLFFSRLSDIRLLRPLSSSPETLAGSEQPGGLGDNGPAHRARVSPGDLALASDGSLFVSDAADGGGRVRRVFGRRNVEKPDLAVTALESGDPRVIPGGPLGVLAALSNAGGADVPAGGFVALSLAPQDGTTPVHLGLLDVPALAPGELSSFSRSFRVPAATPPGPYRLLAEADVFRRLPQDAAGQDNDSFLDCSPVRVEGALKAVVSVREASADALPAGTTVVSISFSEPPDGPPAVTLRGLPGAAVSAPRSLSPTLWELDLTIAAENGSSAFDGPLELTVVASDRGGGPIRSQTGGQFVRRTAPAGPDLVVLEPRVVPPAPTTRDILSVDVVLANAGDVAAGPSVLEVLLDGVAVARRPVASLAPFARLSIPMAATLAPLVAGPHRIDVRADASDAVGERHEGPPPGGNNSVSLSLTPTAGDSSTLVADTVAGSGQSSSQLLEGPAARVGLDAPSDVVADSRGRLLVVERGGIREIDLATGLARRLAGNPTAAFASDGVLARQVRLSSPEGLALLEGLDPILTVPFAGRIRRVFRATGLIGTLAGGAFEESSVAPSRLATTLGGDVVFASTQGGLYRLLASGALELLADRRPAALGGVAVEPSGGILFAETLEGEGRVMSLAGGQLTTVAGGGFETSLPGAALEVRIGGLSGLALDPGTGDLLVVAEALGLVLRIQGRGAGGRVTQVAGNGGSGPGEDGGPATEVALEGPRGVAADPAPERRGVLYVAEAAGHRLRRVTNRGLLSAFDVPDTPTPTAPMLTVDAAPSAGTILPARDVDVFGFAASAGSTYAAAVSPAGLSDGVVSFVAPDGVTVLSESEPGSTACRMNATTSGLHFVLVRARNPADSGSYGVGVRTVQPLRIVPTTLPGARRGERYLARLSSSGGTAPVTWSLGSGQLPAGLVLNPATGSIEGFPLVTSSSAEVLFRVIDGSGEAASRPLTLEVASELPAEPLSIATTTPRQADVGLSYSETLRGTGGVLPYDWTGQGLPSGLTVTRSGTITGRPEGSFEGTISVQVRDLAGAVDSAALPFSVSSVRPRPAVTLGPLLPAEDGESTAVSITSLGQGFAIATVVVAVEFDPVGTRFVGVAPLELSTGAEVPLVAELVAPGRVELQYRPGSAIGRTGGIARLVFAAASGRPARRFAPVFSGARFEAPDGETIFLAPEARAGPDQIVELARGPDGAAAMTIPDVTDPARFGNVVRLDGRGSVDPNLPPAALSYEWRLAAGPVAVALSAPAAATPSFSPPMGGTYEFELLVRNGRAESVPALTRVVVQEIGGNSPPAAIPLLRDALRQVLSLSEHLPPVVVEAGRTLELDGLGSTDPDPLDGAELTYQWTQLAGPALLGTPVEVTSTLSLTPSTPAVYRLGLAVADSAGARSRRAEVRFRVVPAGFARFLSPGVRGLAGKMPQEPARARVASVTVTGTANVPVDLRVGFGGLVDKTAFSRPPVFVRFTLVRGPSSQALPAPVTLEAGSDLQAALRFTPPKPGGYRFSTELISGDPSEGKLADGPEIDLLADPEQGRVPDAVISVTSELRSFATPPPTRAQDRDELPVRAGSVVTLDASESRVGASAEARLEYRWTKLTGSDEVVLSHPASPVVSFLAPAAPGQRLDLALVVAQVGPGKLERVEGVARRISLRTVPADRAVVLVRLERGSNLLSVPVRPVTTDGEYSTLDLLEELGADFVAWPVEVASGNAADGTLRFRTTLRTLRESGAAVSGRLPYLVGRIRSARTHAFVGASWPASDAAGAESAFGLTQTGSSARDAAIARVRGRPLIPFLSTGSWFDRFDEDKALVGAAAAADGSLRLVPVFPEDGRSPGTPRRPLNQPHNAYLRLRRTQ